MGPLHKAHIKFSPGGIMTSPKIEKKKGISPVWILPILAICIGGWLFYTHIQNAGVDITVSFADSVGITAGKTPVRFKGNTVGMVKAIALRKDMQGVNLLIEMNKESAPYLVEDMKFWIEKADVQAGRVTGLDTLLSGSYIGVQPGTSDKPARTFVGLPKRPSVPENAPGLHLTLQADALYSIQAGSGIYHKNILVGSVQEYHLQADETVTINVFIEPEYQHLVKKESRFWNASGLTVTGGVAGIKVHLESFAALIKGGIVMDTPEALTSSPPAESGQTYTLYEDFEAAAYGIPLTLELTSGKGIAEGSTKVIYRGMKVGVVKTISLNQDKHHTVSANVLLDPRAKSILKSGTRFYLVHPQISMRGAKNLDTLITGSYISFKPGDGDYQDHFAVDNDSYPYERPHGTRYTLTAEDAGSLSVGAPVFLKRFQVGEVTEFSLSADASQVKIGILVYGRYAKNVKTTSRFYNLSGVEVKASLSGLKIETGSLQSIISGGLAFYTPKKGAAAKPNTPFILHDDQDAAMDSDRVKIAIRFAQPDGLKEGTAIKYRGAQIGRVTAVRHESDYKISVAEAMVDKQAAPLLRATTQFWLVHSAFSLAGSQHLDTLLSGPYIEMTAGKGKPKKDFQALNAPPEVKKKMTGLNIVLEADDLSSLKPGSPVFYRRVVVGEVTACNLSPTFQQVHVTVNIHQPYTPIVRENTKFWNASGIHVHGGLLRGVSVSTESLQSILAGGVALATPDNDKMGAPVSAGHHFKLYPEAEDKWLEWRPTIRK
jgi:paraquat-inducible protein B